MSQKMFLIESARKAYGVEQTFVGDQKAQHVLHGLINEIWNFFSHFHTSNSHCGSLSIFEFSVFSNGIFRHSFKGSRSDFFLFCERLFFLSHFAICGRPSQTNVKIRRSRKYREIFSLSCQSREIQTRIFLTSTQVVSGDLSVVPSYAIGKELPYSFYANAAFIRNFRCVSYDWVLNRFFFSSI